MILGGNDMKQYTIASLFSGAGGLDLGFENAGFQTIWANDIDEDALKTHAEWSNSELVHGDIEKLNLNKIPETDLILGGFPCQGFSLAGPRKIDDSRNKMYRNFVDLVRLKKPSVLVAENVKGLLTMGEGKIFEAIIEDFSESGYDIFYKLVNSKKFGVPQARERVIIVGFRRDLEIENFEIPEGNGETITIGDAIGDWEEPKDDEVIQDSYSSRFMSRNRKRNWDEFSYTIPAQAKQVPLHPSSPDMEKLGKDEWKFGDDGKTRRFSWKEAAAIQTFPKDLYFHGDLRSKYKQIGNAVPVKLAETVANEIKKTLEKVNVKAGVING